MANWAGMKAGERLLKRGFRFGLRIFFKKMTVLGESRIPARGPLILVANHVNALLDPLILFCVATRPVRFLAKAPLFRNPFVAPFLRAVGALPVHRRKDPGGDPSLNEATFEACEHGLVEGEAVALFPEGISHNEPKLQQLRTGTARIAGRTCRRGTAPAIVPVGLVYTAKSLFRSEVTVVVGHEVAYDDLPWTDGEDTSSVEELTRRIAAGLTAVTVNAERWEDVRLMEGLRVMALELLGVDAREVPEAAAQRRMLEKFYAARLEHPAQLHALLKAARPYLRTLRALGLTDEDVARRVDPGPALAYTWKRLAFLLAGYPPALYGWAFNALPYLLTGPLAREFSRHEDEIATYKFYAGMLLFPLFYVLQTLLLGYALGPLPALAAGLLAVPCGLWALTYYEAREEFVRTASAALTLRNRRLATLRLESMRRSVTEALAPLVDVYR